MHAARLALALTLLAAPGLALAHRHPLGRRRGRGHRFESGLRRPPSPALPVAVAPSGPMTTQEQVDAWLAPPRPSIRPTATRTPRIASPARSTAMVSATIGTGGYRSAYVSTVIPLGETATPGPAARRRPDRLRKTAALYRRLWRGVRL
ncbi:hypothetical protein [Caulobacter sp. B11]|uniref:hypothetical protein n=1 Tax=Caulobacter sp. B11 TaxID=2048899 RepID=UPI00191BAB02|nr:hypothetical protein [Caulobacter sp. B11]